VDPAAPHGPSGAARATDPAPLLVSILALGTVAGQLVFRAADDSRLTSWDWVFDRTDPVRLFALVAAAIAAAHVVARAPASVRWQAPVLIFLSGAAAACFWRTPEVIVDASRYFTQAKYLELHGPLRFLSEWGREIPAWTDLPLVPALYGIVFRVFGESRANVQVLTTLLFAASVALTYRTGEALWNEEVGFAGAAFLLAIPYLLAQVPSMLVDVPTMFFLALALFAVVEAVQRGGAPRILFASIAVFLAFLSKYSAWLLLSGLPVVAIVHRKRVPGALRTGSTIAIVSGLLLLTAVLLRRDVFSRQLALLLGYQAPGLRRWGESFLSTFLFQVHPFLTAGALLSAWMAIRKRDARWIVVAWPVLLLLLLQVRRIRYWVPAFPALALMAALGLQAIRAASPRRLVLLCAVASSLVVALYGQLPFLERTSAVNLKAAGAYLDGLEGRSVEVFTPRLADAAVNPAVSVPILDLYTSKRLVYSYQEPSSETSLAARESPLRFTWEYRNPPYYAWDGAGDPAAVVVISGDLDAPLPEALERRIAGLSLVRTFAADERRFGHRTLVRVYRAPEPGAGQDR